MGDDLPARLSSDLVKQLETIYHCAPGPHEIRVIGRYYSVRLNDKPVEKIWKTGDDRTQVYSIGAPSDASEALSLLKSHFHDRPPHNCFIVLNAVDDEFYIPAKGRKIGGKWFPFIGFDLTKKDDIIARRALPIDIDRAKTPVNESGEKLAASEDELRKLNEARLDIVRELAELGLVPNYQIMSGNGYQVIYFFDPRTDEAAVREKIEAILRGLNEKYQGRADIDTSLADANRMARLCVLNRKPDRVADKKERRIYRVARLVGDVYHELNDYRNVEKLARLLDPYHQRYLERRGLLPKTYKQEPAKPKKFDGNALSSYDPKEKLGETVNEKLRAGGIGLVVYALEKVFGNVVVKGRREDKKQLRCPYHDDHTPSAWISESPDGIAMLHCKASSCRILGNAKTALGILIDAGYDFPSTYRELFGEDPPCFCKYCGEEIIWRDNLPRNPDGTHHGCRGEDTKESEREEVENYINHIEAIQREKLAASAQNK